ncbi:MAG: choice-of-anchor tandem repeat NxxGxxAF-containing protein [Planctomycetota bacterium]
MTVSALAAIAVAVCASTIQAGAQDSSYRVVTSTNDTPVGLPAGNIFIDFGRPTISETGEVAFVAVAERAPREFTTALYRETAGGLALLAAVEQPLPGTGSETVWTFSTASINRGFARGRPQWDELGNAYFFAATGDLNNTAPGIWRGGPDGIVEKVAYAGDPVAGTDLTATLLAAIPEAGSFSTSEVFDVSSTGRVVYTTFLNGPGVESSNDRGVVSVSSPGAEPELIVRKGDPVPTRPSETLDRFGQPFITADGTVFVNARVIGPGITVDTQDRILRKAPGEPVELIFANNKQLPGFPPAITMPDLREVFVSECGSIMFSGFIEGPGISSDTSSVIFSDRGGNGIELELRAGMQVPGFPAGAFYTSLLGFMNDNLTLGFIGGVRETSTTPAFSAFFTEVGPQPINPAITIGEGVPGFGPNVTIERFTWAFAIEIVGPAPAFSPAGFPSVEAEMFDDDLFDEFVLRLTSVGDGPTLAVPLSTVIDFPDGPRIVSGSGFDIDHGINSSSDIAADVGFEDGLEAVVVRSPSPPCVADTNGDGELNPADFNAWVRAFNTQAPACDQNGDGVCNPADFNAWAANFNAGC